MDYYDRPRRYGPRLSPGYSPDYRRSMEYYEDLRSRDLSRARSLSRERRLVPWESAPQSIDVRSYELELERQRSEISVMERKQQMEDEMERRKLQIELEQAKADAKKRSSATEAEDERKRIIEEYDRAKKEEAEKAKQNEKRVREKIEREKKEAKEADERKEKELLMKQKEKEEKEKKEKKEQEEKVNDELSKRLAKFGMPPNQVEAVVKVNDSNQKPQVDHIWRLKNQQFVRVHRDELSKETLRYYRISYDIDRDDGNFYLLRGVDEDYVEMLIDHTREVRARKLFGPKQVDKKRGVFMRPKKRGIF